MIPTYFLVISCAYMICTLWMFFRSDSYDIERSLVLDLSLIIMICGFIGGRLMHVFYERPGYYFRDPLQIIKFWQGGFVFYGGVLGAAIPSILYLRLRQQNIKSWLNFMTPIIALGYTMGRFATLLSGSGFGKPSHLPWAIVYPPGPEAPPGIPLHPTPIYSMLWNGFALLMILIFENKSQKSKFLAKAPNLFCLYMAWHGLGRLIIEQFRNDFRGAVHFGLSVSSWLSLVIIATALLYVLVTNRTKSVQA